MRQSPPDGRSRLSERQPGGQGMCLVMGMVGAVVVNVNHIAAGGLRRRHIILVAVPMPDFAVVLSSRHRCNAVRTVLAQ